MEWPTLEELETAESDAHVIAMGNMMWGSCMAGAQIPDYFGEWMVRAGHRLNIIAIPEEFLRLADEFIADAQAQRDEDNSNYNKMIGDSLRREE